MARFEATAAIVALLVGAGGLVASGCEEPEAFQHNGQNSFLGGSGGRGVVAGAGGGGAGEGGASPGDIGGAGGLTGAAGEMAAPGGGPGDVGGAAGEAPGGAPGFAGGQGGVGVAEGGHPAGSAGAGGRASIGTAGAGGSGRPMGSGGAAGGGAGGTVAAGGRSGAGAAGGNGVGGLGGAAGGAPPCGTCTLSIQCRNYAPTDTTAMNAELWISNTGEQPIVLGMIKVRYYYTNEGGPMTLEIFDKAFKRPDGSGYQPATASFSMTSGKVARPPMDFSEIAITGSTTLNGTVPFYFKMAIHDLNHSKLTLTNDYSNPPVAIGPCPTIVALVGNAVAGGVPPR
jgi:hypothetical protein